MRKIQIYSLTAILTLTLLVPTAYADQLNSTQQKKTSVDSQIKKIGQEKKQVESEKKKLEAEQKKVLSAQEKEKQVYNELVNELDILNKEIDKIDEAIKESEENYNTQKELFKTRLRVMYENSNYSFFETLIKSKSFTDLLQRLEIMSVLSKKDKQLVEDLKVAKEDVESKKLLKEEEKQEMKDQADEKKESIDTYKLASRSLDEQIRKNTEKLKILEKREDELVRQSDALAKEIKNLSKNKKYDGGKFKWPLPSSYNVVSPYGMRMHPILKKKKMHTGIDIDGNTGNSIVAAYNGTVIMSQYRSGYGNTVVIDHGDGITTLYAHCSKLLVKVGAEVKAGQVIAKVGSTGLSTGPHLHFEVRKNGATTNPMNYFGK